ncbi:MAG TPA: hypothetical protein PLA74_04765 [Syntrophales bacterium]|nr:hypothetical protein [Syntrophales bacterium]HPQ44340.1 hypothetical protein [Syntrophales bacterium]
MIQKIRKTTILTLMLGTALLISGGMATPAEACKMDIRVDGTAKDTYSVGDELILKVTVYLTHRNCPEGIDTTQFGVSSLKVLGATEWSETSRNNFERLIKVEILPSETGEALMEAKRVCSKEGGYASLRLKVTS